MSPLALPRRSSARAIRAALPKAGLVLASTGRPFSATALDTAAGLARDSGTRVRVVTVARIHGSSFGLQHPGLLPSKKEKDAARTLVTDAVAALQRRGLRADGEVVITRSPGQSFARVARAAGDVRHVVVDEAGSGPLRRWSAKATGRAVSLRARNAAVLVLAGGVAC